MNRLLTAIADHAVRQPQAPALTSATLSLNYADLWQRVNALADWLRTLPPGVLALELDNSVGWVVIDLACQLAERPLLPLPGYFSADQRKHALATAGAFAVLQAATIDHDSSTPTGILNVPGWADLILMPLLSNDDALTAATRRALSTLPPDTAKITFTSGSTGHPKGVCLSQNNQIVVAESLASVIADPAPRHLCVLPLATLLENVAGVYVPLLCGGEVLLPSLRTLGHGGSRTLDPQAFVAQISMARPASLILVPQLLDLLVLAAGQGWTVPDSLRFVAVGGSRVAPEAVARARALGIPAFEGYGLSECSSVVSLNTPARDLPGSAGQVLPHLQVRIGPEGDLTVTGNAFLGYAGQPDSWLPAHIETGDLARRDENGFLHLAGRRKHLLINSYGRNISPEWVESEVLAHPGIRECLVLGDARPFCSALLFAPALDDLAIKQWLSQINAELPDYARVLRWHRLPALLQADPEFTTANGRPRRDRIAQRLHTLIDTLYAPLEETCS